MIIFALLKNKLFLLNYSMLLIVIVIYIYINNNNNNKNNLFFNNAKIII